MAHGQGTWEILPVPTQQRLRSVCFTDSLYGWAAGDSGIILHTTDGGAGWVRQHTDLTDEIWEVFFLDREKGWASASNFTDPPYGTRLLKTTDGGANWSVSDYPAEDVFIHCILYLDSLNGWMGGSPHALVRTHDGGATWTQAEVDTSTLAFFPVLCIRFYDGRHGYASGGRFDIAGVLWNTHDSGATWRAIDVSQAPADEVHSLHLFDSLNVMGAGGDPDFGYGVGMTRTTDGGINWLYDELDIQGNAYDLDFRNDTEVWAPLGPRRLMIYSLDGGVTWSDIDTPDQTAIYDMTFPDDLHGYAVGKEGAFLKYKPPVMPGIAGTGILSQGYVLEQNVPNPAGTTATIRYTIPGLPGAVSRTVDHRLVMISPDGRVSAVYDLGRPAPGTHSCAIQAGDLPQGLILYMLQARENGQYRTVAGPCKMLIVSQK